ncbi:MAG: L-fuculose-phosphate aldolase [Acetobacterium sp.]|nr:L-fuculose-phosphate aldolase [Acetobacterium sp.]
MSNEKNAREALNSCINQLKSANIELGNAFLALRLSDDAFLATVPVTHSHDCDDHHFSLINQEELRTANQLAYSIFLADHKKNAVILTHSRFCSLAAKMGQDIPAALDDMAQIIGLTMKTCAFDEVKKINRVFKKNRGCLIKSNDPDKQGAIAVGKNLGEALIVTLLMEKAAQVHLQAIMLGGAKTLKPLEAQIMHLGYELSYSKISGSLPHQTPSDLSRSLSSHELTLRNQLVELGQSLSRENLVQGTWGNISIRLDHQYLLCTPSGMGYLTLTPYDMVQVEINTLKYEGKLKPTGEKALHAALYASHPNVHCVIHTHPVYGSVFAAAHQKIVPPNPELAKCLGGDVELAEYAFPTSKQLSVNVVKAIKDNRACVMENHGMVVCGATPDEAHARCRAAEKSARLILEALYQSR